MTGRVQIVLFTTLDLVAQAPGGPEEDPSDGFPYGGWQAPLDDDVVGEQISAGIAELDALVLGRRTYDIFAGYWPHHGAPRNPIGERLNEVPKYVASRGNPSLEWNNSSLLGSDLHEEFAAIRERHDRVQVIGSVDFVQTLLAERLFDELALWVYPVVLGTGKKVFPNGAAPANLELLAPPLAGSAGAVLLRYGPRAGLPEVGVMGEPES